MAAFSTYFCMYAFRKPFAAAEYEGLYYDFFGIEFGRTAAFAISQIIGYALSKYLGCKYCAEIDRRQHARMLVILILFAELALLGFAALPKPQ